MARATLYPFKVSTLAWESRPGKWNMTICLKATYVLAHAEEPTLGPRQDGMHEAIYFDQAPLASLYSPSDFVPFKQRTDVLLVGHAHAPGGDAVSTLMVRLTVGNFSKALHLCGERAWVDAPQGPRTSLPRPFSCIPLRYERAVRKGDNLVGTARGDATRPAPNIDMAAESDGTPGFGPIAPSWRAFRDPHVEEATLWAGRLRRSHRAGAAPFGMSLDVFNTAPRDQQLDALTPGTPLVLENLHPRIPRLMTRTPSVVPKVFHVDPGKSEPREVMMRPDTLWIDTDHGILVMSWRGVTGIAAPEVLGAGKILVAAHAPGAIVTFDEVEAIVRGAATAQPLGSGRHDAATVRLPRIPEKTAPLPAVAAVTSSERLASQPHGAEPTVRLPMLPPPVAPEAPKKRLPPTLDLDGVKPLPIDQTPFPIAAPAPTARVESTSSTLGTQRPVPPVSKPGDHVDDVPRIAPRVPPVSPPSAPPPHAAPRRVPATVDLDGTQPIVPSTAPFPLASPGSTTAAGPIAGAPWASEAATPAPASSTEQRETLPLVHARMGPMSQVREPTMVALCDPAAPPSQTAVAPPPDAARASPPPEHAFLPAATPHSSSTPATPAQTSAFDPLDKPATVAAAVPVLPLDAYPIERCAAISASIARRTADKEAILVRNDLAPEMWSALARHWAEALQREQAHDRVELLSTYDAAYVAQLEAERGAITVKEYAELIVAVERGKQREVLAALGLPGGALVRVQRVWMRKMGENPALRSQAREAIRSAGQT